MGWFEKRIAENHGLFVDTCEGHQQVCRVATKVGVR